MSSLDGEDVAAANASEGSRIHLLILNIFIMKQYIIIRHSDGLYNSVDAQFDNLEDALNYAKLASMGNKGWTYEVFERHQ